MNARPLALCAALALAGCQSSSLSTGPLEAPKGATQTPGVEAVLLPKNGTAAQGDAKLMLRGETISVLVSLNNLPPGPYRVAIHERGNCTSPNAFSAGKPWAPAGYPRAATELIPAMTVGAQGHGQLSYRLAGVPFKGPDSLEGRSVVVHAGDRVDADLRPGVPNGVVLCGVIGPIRSFMELFN
jgi:Cu-Zn family superoxide dismutase